MRLGSLTLDFDRYLARWKDRAVTLTVTEFLLLAALARHPGHVKTRKQLLEQGYPHDAYVSERTIDSHVKRLRAKFVELDPTFDGDRHGLRPGLPLPRGDGVSWLARVASRIAVRLLAFNLLLVFLPTAGLLYLEVYERQLLDAQERAMVQQGRVLAAALSERGPLRAADAEPLLARLRQQSEARLRVLDPAGQVLADSSLLGPRREPDGEPPPAAPASPGRPAPATPGSTGSAPGSTVSPRPWSPRRLRSPSPRSRTPARPPCCGGPRCGTRSPAATGPAPACRPEASAG